MVSKGFPGDVLKESTFRGWRDACNKVVDERVKEAKNEQQAQTWMCKLYQKRNAVVL